MTEKQANFVRLEKQRDTYKQYLLDLEEAEIAVANEIGINEMFQDDEGTVYQIIVPEGKYVHFEKVGYERTKRVGEVKGTLSIAKATAAGFKF